VYEDTEHEVAELTGEATPFLFISGNENSLSSTTQIRKRLGTYLELSCRGTQAAPFVRPPQAVSLHKNTTSHDQWAVQPTTDTVFTLRQRGRVFRQKHRDFNAPDESS
jgi:hypothetical protein